MASTVIPFPSHRVKYRAEIEDAQIHIAHLHNIMPTLSGLSLEMAHIVLDVRERELAGYLSPELRRA